MTDAELTVTVNAVERIDAVTEAIKRLSEALDEVGEGPVRLMIDQFGEHSHTQLDTTASGEWITMESETDFKVDTNE